MSEPPLECVCGAVVFRSIIQWSWQTHDDKAGYYPDGWSAEIECFACGETYNLPPWEPVHIVHGRIK